jgi:hypothetical protein
MLCKPFDPYSHVTFRKPSPPWLPGLDRYKPHARELLACRYAEISKNYWERVQLRAYIYRKLKNQTALNSPTPYF